MPRPTVAQLAYGSATVVLSTLAMLLLSQTSSGPGIGVIAMSAVILGLFVALNVPRPKQEPARDARQESGAESGSAAERVPTQRVISSEPAHEPTRERAPVHETAGP
ncbi:hypothetical protein [Streptomyces sp. VRA16 Mangrove soil]|uniref:hypothetical protein n=1 Tax=Streptomyces sp. VRA16 Mangrove soil TaxID=2817434 RepID=UPI001A9EA6A3|nr:hypothetical protein [Streptomyces sp. VRA16 Mangrove soil]MBO1337740.1 hypothetical protein [Streptomyces sp. VRA16 Mangrove soil]